LHLSDFSNGTGLLEFTADECEWLWIRNLDNCEMVKIVVVPEVSIAMQ
jgi:hypothetical protein